MMLVHSLWDQEDIYAVPALYSALEGNAEGHEKVFLTLGPWDHGQEIGNGSRTGNIGWDQDTAKWWRWHVLAPFLAHYLKDQPMDVAPVTAFQSGTNEWQQFAAWPPRAATSKLYLKPGFALGFTPAVEPVVTADYVSDPTHPVTFIQRPIPLASDEDESWQAWLTDDQRGAAARPDVLTFVSPLLDRPVAIAGQPAVHLTASTSGTDSDWVVKLIDVYPDQMPVNRAMGGYEFPVSMDIFRGRYRESLDRAVPLAPNTPLAYMFALPPANHVFLPGHRIMVQIQSSWFPLYDRNPQTFVPNIFFAQPGDYVTAKQKVTVSGPDESFIFLPIAN